MQAYMEAAHHKTFPAMTNMERNGSSGIISCMGKQYVSMLGIQISINEYLPRNANTLLKGQGTKGQGTGTWTVL